MQGVSKGVLLLYNEPEPEGGSFAWTASEAGVLQAVAHVEEALRGLGRPVRRAAVHDLRGVGAAVAAGPECVVLNLVERLEGGPFAAAAVPSACEALGRACTGADAACLSLTQDKALTKTRLASLGIETPEGAAVWPGAALPSSLPPFPLFVKPLWSDGSEGIGVHSIVRERRAALADAVAAVHATCGQPALIESFVDGREFNAAVCGGTDTPLALPLAEIDFSRYPADRPHIVDYEVKWRPGTIPGHVSPRRVPAEVDEATAERIRATARAAWRACGCRDYARVDCRLDRNGRLYVLEVNANCDLSPLAGFVAALRAAGIPFERFVGDMVARAAGRV
jgi:D-alanine-D-alanine ligase